MSVLFDAVATAQTTWQDNRDGSKFGKVKKAFARVVRSVDDHSELLAVLPKNDKYVSIVAGTLSSVVKAR